MHGAFCRGKQAGFCVSIRKWVYSSCNPQTLISGYPGVLIINLKERAEFSHIAGDNCNWLVGLLLSNTFTDPIIALV